LKTLLPIEERSPDAHSPTDYGPSRMKRSVTSPAKRSWFSIVRQFLRFGLVGGLNTIVDLLILNALLWIHPTQRTLLLIIYNSIAYGIGAINSFVLNKYWTFERRQRTTATELLRFALTTVAGILVNDLLIWVLSSVLQPFTSNITLWTNAAKILAILGTSSISYLGMRLWVFVNRGENHEDMQQLAETISTTTDEPETLFRYGTLLKDSQSGPWMLPARTEQSLSVVLPAHNEERIIVHTVFEVLETVSSWIKDFEVIVVNDGSTDQTAALVTDLARSNSRVRLINHEHNQGYGAALVSGFAAATKNLTFFIDSDGQFDIRDLQGFLPFSDEYDAVIGYRVDRQDTWIRKLNAWGWKQAVGLMLGVHVRDLDCAFKLLHTQFLHEHPLETRSAMINAELMYKLKRAGCTYKQIGVHHLPRQGGRATGANIKVILRAFRDLFRYSSRWKREQRQINQMLLMRNRREGERREKRYESTTHSAKRAGSSYYVCRCRRDSRDGGDTAMAPYRSRYNTSHLGIP